MGRKIISDRQLHVLGLLHHLGTLRHPRHTLERLHKKGLVQGDRRRGWSLTQAGRDGVVRICAERSQHV